jgi:cell division protein FtsZ
LRSRNARCLFGFGESDSDNRAHEALTQALKNPLMDRGRMLEEAARVLVQVAGGPGMTLSEVEILMQELGRHVGEQTQILFGAAVDGRLGDRLTVTIITSLTADEDFIPEQTQPALSSSPAKLPVWEQPQENPPNIEMEPAPMEVSEPAEMIPFEEPASAESPLPPPMEPLVDKPEPIVTTQHKTPAKEEKPSPEKSVQAKQEVLQFEAVTRGRFEKSEPTIVEGEDLDVPTYLRKKVKVK